MYKVFFNDRIVFITTPKSGITLNNEGLNYYYHSFEELKEIIAGFRNMEEVEKLILVHDDLELVWHDFKKCFTFIEAAGGIVYNINDEILIINRLNKVDLPKGKLEKNESVEKAAMREVSEECGIHQLTLLDKLITTYHTYMLYDEPILKATHWYSIFHDGKELPVPQIKEKIVDARWIQKQDVKLLLNNTYKSIITVFEAADLI